MIGKAILILLLLFVLSYLGAESWTVLVYMAADNNLADNGRLDINSMESVSQPANLNIIVQADFPEGAKRYRIQQDNSSSITSPVVADLGLIDSGDPNTLNSFIQWGFGAYPAERRMLVLWSHGDSWYKGDDSKWICRDYTTFSQMSLANGDMAIAFAGAPQLDILLFDACSMQGIEVLGEVYQYADYIIGSADLVPANGFPYEGIIPLFGSPLPTLLEQIPLLYVESYLPGGEINTGNQFWTITCSTLRSSLYHTFRDKFKGFATHFRQEADLMMQIRQSCFAMNTGYADVDLRQFLTLLSANSSGALKNATDELKGLWNSMVISSAATTPQLIPDIGTGALWFPDIRYNFDNGWQTYHHLDFARTRWLSVVNVAIGEDTTVPEQPVLLSQSVVLRTLHLQVGTKPDPDSLYYELTVSEGRNPRSQFIYPNPENASFFVSIQVTASGSYQLVAIDQSGNRSQPMAGSYSLSELQTSLLIAPNPVRGKHLATVRWWATDNDSGRLHLQMYNLRGQLIFAKDLGEVISGEGMELLSANQQFTRLPAGLYFIRLHIGAKHFTRKITILY